ncbi:unnamed protein product [Diplocarpon coronariae]
MSRNADRPTSLSRADHVRFLQLILASADLDRGIERTDTEHGKFLKRAAGFFKSSVSLIV